ncbi:MAG TPA: hypothetical protein VIX58_01015 [Anaerolineae bacterium]
MRSSSSRARSTRHSNLDIRPLHKTIDSALTNKDWRDLILMLAARSKRPDAGGLRAAELLLRYRFGQPTPAIDQSNEDTHPIEIIEIFSQKQVPDRAQDPAPSESDSALGPLDGDDELSNPAAPIAPVPAQPEPAPDPELDDDPAQFDDPDRPARPLHRRDRSRY